MTLGSFLIVINALSTYDFCNKQCEDHHVVSITGMNIKSVYVTKFLGVHIDSHLNWCEHINDISKISKNMCL